MKTLTRALPDLLLVLGAGAIAYGAGLLHPAAGCMVAGALTLAGGVCAARRLPHDKDQG